jgi:coenzyme F420-reducing hydrogenase gamma subunit
VGRPKIGIFSFASCEGCQLQILSIDEELLDLVDRLEIVNFREAIDEKRDDYDIAFVEGSIASESDAEEVRAVRSRASFLVTIGACAVTTGVNGMRNSIPVREAWKAVYPDRELDPNVASEARRVSEVVKVDFEIPGCPIDRRELLEVVATLLRGQVPRLPAAPVCDECRRSGNPCLLDRGIYCFGPISRAGCGAICPSFGESCCGCRGLLRGAPVEELLEIHAKKGLSREEIVVRLGQFNSGDGKVRSLAEEIGRGRKGAAA